MSAAFGLRRKARAVGINDDGDDGSQATDSGSAVKRPHRPKHRSRVSLGLGGTSMADEEDKEETVITPKRGLVRQALEKNASRSSSHLRASSDNRDDPLQEGDQSQPSYTKEYLSELKSAQSTKLENEGKGRESVTLHNAQVTTKFGTEVSTFIQDKRNTLIPTDLEIQALKARRARLAKLEEYNIDPEASGDDDPRDDRPGSDEDEFLTQRDKISLRDERTVSKKEVDTRLVRDDEDLMEGFEDLTGESTRVPLGSSAQDKARARQRAEMRELIEQAQDEDQNDGSDSEVEQREEYEASQARKGMDNLQINGGRKPRSIGEARTPPKITPIPDLEECVQRLRGRLLDMEQNRKVKLSRLEGLQAEKKEIVDRESEIQRLLTEKAAEYEKMSAEVGSGQRLLDMNRPSTILPGRSLESIDPSGSGSLEIQS